MRKILITFFLFFPIFFLSSFNTNAGCNSNLGLGATCTIPCTSNGNSFCCATQQECNNFQNQPTPTINCVRKQPSSCSKIVCHVGNGDFCCDTQVDCNNQMAATPVPWPSGNSDLWCDPNWLGVGTKLNTAIGCIPILSTKEAFLSFVLKWAVGIGGGIAFLLIIYAGFMIMTSAGNPERLKAGQELLTSAISGLILLIFSVVILKIIGVDILGLDNFGFN